MAQKLLASIAVLLLACSALSGSEPSTTKEATKDTLGEYVILGWNDLGMHCMNGEFSQLTILPPYNNLWVQVIQRGNPPILITSGMDLRYRFPDNTSSADKVNFWEYEEAMFGVNLPEDIGLAGKGLSGNLDWNGNAWEAEGIPITPFDDANPTVEQPYQLAEVTLRREPNGEILDQTMVVVPVSTEIHCDICHDGSDDKKSPTALARMSAKVECPPTYVSVFEKFERDTTTKAIDPVLVAQDILREHDEVDGQSLMDMRPVLCATCHSSNALGTSGRPGVKSLSQSVHEKHGEIFSAMDCYACHPGNQTQCLRGAMYTAGQTCQDCHGNIREVARSIEEGRRPWIDEPKCGTCHPGYEENPGTLYRNSIGHGGVYCTACHGSPHAELPTVQPRDNFQAIRVQGVAKTISNCMVCHTKLPRDPGPHGIKATFPELWLAF